jgi:hypothetical protein
MTCPRCNTRLLREPDQTWYCINHGTILTPDQQQALEDWRKLNAEIAGDTRKMRGGLGKGTVPTRVVPEMGVTHLGRWATFTPCPKNEDVSDVYHGLEIVTHLGRARVREARVQVGVVQADRPSSQVRHSEVQLRTTDFIDRTTSEAVPLPGSLFAWGEGETSCSGRGRTTTPSRRVHRHANRLVDEGRGQLRMAI